MNFTQEDIQIALHLVNSSMKEVLNHTSLHEQIDVHIADDYITKYFCNIGINVDDLDKSFETLFYLFAKYHIITNDIIKAVNVIRLFVYWNKLNNNWKFY